MRAVLCKAFGPPEDLVLEEVPSPKPQAGEVVLSVKAAAVNFPDTLIIQGKYQFQPPFPFSPGGEVAGEVKEVGSEVANLKVGDRVIGSCGAGGFAEEIALDAGRCQPIPEGMDYATASAFVMTYGTSHHALKDRAQLQAGESLLVLGAAGGVGLAAVELGKAMGARVIAAASSEDKLKLASEHGADATLLYSAKPMERDEQKKFSEKIKELSGGEGVDVVYDPVGGSYSEPALRAMAWKGRFLVIGFAAGDIPRLPLNLPLLKGCQIVGVFWGAFVAREAAANNANLQDLMVMVKAGKLRPHVSKKFPLEQAADALKHMSARKVLGKIVITME